MDYYMNKKEVLLAIYKEKVLEETKMYLLGYCRTLCTVPQSVHAFPMVKHDGVGIMVFWWFSSAILQKSIIKDVMERWIEIKAGPGRKHLRALKYFQQENSSKYTSRDMMEYFITFLLLEK